MKIAVTIGTKDAYPKALVVFRGIEENIERIAQLGYDGIEIALWEKDNIAHPDRLKDLLRKYNMDVPVISTGQIFTVLEAWFTHPEKQVRDKAVNAFKGILDLAGEFGADVNISRVRGFIDESTTQEEGLRLLTGCLEELSSHAGRYGLNLLLEQMNRYETNYMLSVDEVGRYIRRTGIPNLKIHADTFHMNIEDVDLCKTLRDNADLLGYIHFSDSNRLAPGMGNIDFRAIVRTLDETRYSGWTGIEILPQPDAWEAATSAIEYLRGL